MHSKNYGAQRFQFGENWMKFLSELNDTRINLAEESLKTMLDVDTLEGKTFLDVGSGSGLFSLAARRLGARVHSFDYDRNSVRCTVELKRRYFDNDSKWVIEKGSVLDQDYLRELGKFDVVYSWGVLHHTGSMWQALENITPLASSRLFIAIYNDQGRSSNIWLAIKKLYNWLPNVLRWLVLTPVTLRLWGPTMIRDMCLGRPFHTWRHYSELSMRGMSPWRDVVDWVGGLPFEVAKPDEIFYYYEKRGFLLKQLKTSTGGLGCNEFVFYRKSSE
jgi:2-polyprenyl-6-hydroxyphenyl methylase/3-demethylubiquinone-9 3-methyltransferase